MKYAVAIDIGGTNTRVALVDTNKNIVKRDQFPTNPTEPSDTLDKIAQTVLDYSENIIGAGMSCPGPLDLINGRILTPPNLQGGWRNFNVTKALEDLIHIPVTLDNDANLAALAEATVGEGREYRTVQFLTISTGIGAGLVVNGKVHIGTHGFANEVANCIMWQDGPSHGSILPGGIEAICSGTAITIRAQNAGLSVKHAGEVNELALSGNDTARRIMTEAKTYLANFIAFIYAYMDPDIVILGGSVALKVPGFVEEVESLVKNKVFDVLKPHIKVHKSTLSEDSGLIGAACLAFSKENN